MSLQNITYILNDFQKQYVSFCSLLFSVFPMYAKISIYALTRNLRTFVLLNSMLLSLVLENDISYSKNNFNMDVEYCTIAGDFQRYRSFSLAFGENMQNRGRFWIAEWNKKKLISLRIYCRPHLETEEFNEQGFSVCRPCSLDYKTCSLCAMIIKRHRLRKSSTLNEYRR